MRFWRISPKILSSWKRSCGWQRQLARHARHRHVGTGARWAVAVRARAALHLRGRLYLAASEPRRAAGPACPHGGPRLPLATWRCRPRRWKRCTPGGGRRPLERVRIKTMKMTGTCCSFVAHRTGRARLGQFGVRVAEEGQQVQRCAHEEGCSFRLQACCCTFVVWGRAPLSSLGKGDAALCPALTALPACQSPKPKPKGRPHKRPVRIQRPCRRL